MCSFQSHCLCQAIHCDAGPVNLTTLLDPGHASTPTNPIPCASPRPLADKSRPYWLILDSAQHLKHPTTMACSPDRVLTKNINIRLKHQQNPKAAMPLGQLCYWIRNTLLPRLYPNSYHLPLLPCCPEVMRFQYGSSLRHPSNDSIHSAHLTKLFKALDEQEIWKCFKNLSYSNVIALSYCLYAVVKGTFLSRSFRELYTWRTVNFITFLAPTWSVVSFRKDLMLY